MSILYSIIYNSNRFPLSRLRLSLLAYMKQMKIFNSSFSRPSVRRTLKVQYVFGKIASL